MQLEMKMLLDRLGDVQMGLQKEHVVSDVLLRLSELLEVEGYPTEARCARELGRDTRGTTVSSLKDHLDMEDTEEVLARTWVALPEGIDEEKAVQVLLDFIEGKLKYPPDNPA